MKNWGRFFLRLFLFSWVFIIFGVSFFSLGVNKAEANIASFFQMLPIFKKTAEVAADVANTGISYSLDPLGQSFFKIIFYVIASTIASILFWSGTFLDLAILISIDNFSNFANSEFIQQTWVLIRDLINISFIFIILYIAIKLILKGSSYNIKKTLGGVVAAALLINFSLFFVRVSIDASNILSIKLYDSFAPDRGNVAVDVFKNFSLEEFNKYSENAISGKVMRHLGLQELWHIGDINNLGLATNIFDQNSNISNSNLIFSSIIMLLFAACFITIGIMFLIRIVTLIILLITSPFGITTYFLNSGDDNHKKWISTLSHNLVFPPVFFIFMIILFQFMSTIRPTTNFTSALHSGGFVPMLATNMIVIGLLFAAVSYTHKAGKWGSKWAVKIGTVSTFGAVGYAGRHTIGRGAAEFSSRNPNLLDSASGRLILKATDKLSNASFNAGNLKSLNKIGFESGGEGGYTKYSKDKKEEFERMSERAKKPTPQEQEKITDFEEKRVAAGKEIKDKEYEKRITLLKKYREMLLNLSELQIKKSKQKDPNKAAEIQIKIDKLAPKISDIVADLSDIATSLPEKEAKIYEELNDKTLLHDNIKLQEIFAKTITELVNVENYNATAKKTIKDLKKSIGETKKIGKNREDDVLKGGRLSDLLSNARAQALEEIRKKRIEEADKSNSQK